MAQTPHTTVLLSGAVTAVVLALSGCTSATPPAQPAPLTTATSTPPAATATPAVEPVATVTVPDGLVGSTVGKAKTKLAKLGFTRVVVAGGDITDTDPVVSVSKAGEAVPPNTRIVIVGEASAPEPAPVPSLAECSAMAAQDAYGNPPQVCLDAYPEAGDANAADPALQAQPGVEYFDPAYGENDVPPELNAPEPYFETSGEAQHHWGCQQGYIPAEQC